MALEVKDLKGEGIVRGSQNEWGGTEVRGLEMQIGLISVEHCS